MKKLWSALLVCLFIGASLYATQNFSGTYAPVDIVTEPYMIKDFARSEEYNVSDQSIPSFSETLPDNVLFYPDSLTGEILLADGGNNGTYNNYNHTWVQGEGVGLSDYLITVSGESDEIYFLGEFEGIIEDFDYALYGFGDGTGTVEYYDGGWQALETITSEDWYNGTISLSSINGTVRFQFSATGGHDLYIDYAQVQITYMTTSDNPTNTLSEIYYATEGDTGFDDTYAVDDVNFDIEASGPYYNITSKLGFDYDTTNISSILSFTYHIYGSSPWSFSITYSTNWGASWSGHFETVANENWYNGTITTNLDNTGTLYFAFYYTGSIDYMDISLYYEPRSTSYSESFSDVSDWILEDGDEIVSSDGDIVEIEMTTASDDNYKGITADVNIPIDSSTVIELSMLCNTTFDDFPQIRLYDSVTGDFYFHQWVEPVVWTTYTFNIKSVFALSGDDFTEITLVQLLTKLDTGEQVTTSYDYLRIGPPDEMGWSYDGSTILGVEAFNGGSISTDGDYLSLISDADGAIFNFTIDTTSTACAVNPVYYPFVEVKIHEDDVGNDILLRAFFGGAPSTILSKFTTTNSSIRANILSITGTGYEVFQLFVYSSQTIRVNFVQAYSIANYTVARSGSPDWTVDDYLYVDNGVLVSVAPVVGWMRLDIDLTLSIDTTTYNIGNATISSGASNFRFREYVDGAWEWFDQGVTQWDSSSGTLADFMVYLYGDCALSAISFLGILPQWHEIDNINLVFDSAGWNTIDTIILYFLSSPNEWALNTLFIFLGLFMIPASTIFFVKGGRSEMSTDKLLVVILCFFMGWALFLGGIFA